MKNYRKYLLGLIITMVWILAGSINIFAADDANKIYYLASNETVNDTKINIQNVNGENYLFLPSSADLKKLQLYFDGGDAVIKSKYVEKTITNGKMFNFSELFPYGANEGKYSVYFSNNVQSKNIIVMKSANIGSMYITTANPKTDLKWIEAVKGNKAKDNPMVMLRADGTCVYDGTLKNIKGRGNSTWGYKKKPYQIKLENKTDLLETGNPDEIQETWVLLANFIDSTLIKNSITYDLAEEFGLKYSPHSEMIDLYYDGNYRGTYLLSEKTEVGSGRVDVDNMDKSIEEVNSDIEDFDKLSTKIEDNANIKYQYVSGLISPESITGGYLLELDYLERMYEEKSWFISENGNNIVCKSPEYATEDAMKYISSIWKEFEDSVYNGGVNPETGKNFDEYIDLESLAKYYLILELSMEADSFQSSTYFYKKSNDNKLYAGPVWDFDSAYKGQELLCGASMGSLVAGQTGIGKALLSIPEFRMAVQKYYKEELYDIVKNIILSKNGSHTENLNSVYGYGKMCNDSQLMNANLWSLESKTNYSYSKELDNLYNIISERNEKLYNEIMNWNEDTKISTKFFDVSENMWYHDTIINAVDKGLFNGISNFIFDPEKKCSRAMIASVLYRMEGQPAVKDKNVFSDVNNSDWYYDAVMWAYQNNIVKGYTKNLFCGNESATRQQIVTMLYRYYCYTLNRPASSEFYQSDLQYIRNKFIDGKDISNYAINSLKWASDNGLVKGDDANRLLPQNNTTRAEAATIFVRYIENTASN